MSLKVCVFGSGSSGNCIFVASETTKILVDMGLSGLRVERCLKTLGEGVDNLSVLITHAHSDHVSGADKFSRRHEDANFYCHSSCYDSLAPKLDDSLKHMSVVDGDFFVGDITVSPFKVSHDVPCVGYSLLCGGKKVTIATDIGKVSDRLLTSLSDSDLLVLESNHDEDMVNANPRYSQFLKKRILSDKGHLSNAACARCVEYLARQGVRQVVLAHLSRENNYPELAFETCKNYLLSKGLTEGKDVKLEVALADRMSSLFEIV